MFQLPRMMLTRPLVSRAPGTGRSMVPSIHLNAVLVAHIPSASIRIALAVK